jgi:hypothetical protein
MRAAPANTAGVPSATAGAPAAGANSPAANTAGVHAAGSGGAAHAAAGSGATQTPGVACNPADKKPNPTPASYTKIKGYEQLTKVPTTGPSAPILETDPGLKDWTVYRPEVLAGEALHPVVAWANGGCLQNGTLYGPWLLELASYGYIVLADGPPTEPGSDVKGAGMRAGTDKAQLTAIDWLIAENDRPCSQYYHTVDTSKLAVAGQSCGGLMSLTVAASDKRITTTVIGNSGLFAADKGIYSGLHAPLIYLIGGMNDMAYQNAERDYMNIETVPIFYGNMDTGHGGTWNATNGGEFGRVGLAWLNWQMKGDETAKKLFVGADCELCKPPSKWTVKKKMLD